MGRLRPGPSAHYPDAVTGGLAAQRRTPCGVLERTRSDLITITILQSRLQGVPPRIAATRDPDPPVEGNVALM